MVVYRVFPSAAEAKRLSQTCSVFFTAKYDKGNKILPSRRSQTVYAPRRILSNPSDPLAISTSDLQKLSRFTDRSLIINKETMRKSQKTLDKFEKTW